jgi:hypothetical protein
VTLVPASSRAPNVPLTDLVLAGMPPAEPVLPDLSLLTVPDVGSALVVPTGYGDNSVVEPSILYDVRAPFMADANGQNGYEYVLCAAPYFGSNAALENPCLWVSHDGTTWLQVVFTAGVGVVNTGAAVTATPIVAQGNQGDGNNSDPYLVRGQDGTYYIIWNQFLNPTGSGGTGTGSNDWGIKGIQASSLAGPWTTPVSLLQQVRATRRDSSPCAFYDGTKWQIYAIDLHDLTVQAPITRYTVSGASLLGTWAVQSNPTIALPAAYSTQTWWHVTSLRWGARHVLILQDNIINSSSSGNMWIVWSDDGGTTWTVPNVPFLSGSWYRSAAPVAVRTRAMGFDILLGNLAGGVWSLYRGNATLSPLTYAGVGQNGVPNHSAAVSVAKQLVTPYTVGDTANRADSAVLIGTLDSGQTFTVATGTWGISSKQIYVAVSGGNNKVTLALTGNADGIYACEYSVIDTAIQQYLIIRNVDANNFVRLGYATTGKYKIENIVAGGVSQSAVSTLVGPVSGDILTAVCFGSAITVYVNGSKILGVTGWTANQTGSGIGLQSNGTSNARWRNLYARPLVVNQ